MNMPTIGNKKRIDQKKYEEIIYKRQLKDSHGKVISDLDHEYTRKDVEKEIKRRKK